MESLLTSLLLRTIAVNGMNEMTSHCVQDGLSNYINYCVLEFCICKIH